MLILFFYYYFCIIFIGDKFTEYLSTTYKLCQNDIKAIKVQCVIVQKQESSPSPLLHKIHAITIDS